MVERFWLWMEKRMAIWNGPCPETWKRMERLVVI
jgi:hypothetical protein